MVKTLKERLIISTVVSVAIGGIWFAFMGIDGLIGIPIGSFGYSIVAHLLCKRYGITWL